MPEPLCKIEIPDLARRLRELIAQVPAGRVTTCGDLAEALGNRIAARWVGQFTLEHDHTAGCPCHRVVRAGGQLGPYIDGGETIKARRLRAEGIEVQQDAVDLKRCGFDRFRCDRPLEELRRVQEALPAKVSLRPRRRIPKLVGGVDVSYPGPGEGVAAYALVETDSGRLVWSKTVRRRVVFPYITSYLAFRELPILLELLEVVRTAGRLSQVLLVDGSGILHQRHAGIATHLGVVASLPTIGVTKKLLCGHVELEGITPGESRPVVYEDRLIGTALRTSPRSRRPIFISPGHRLDVAFAERLVRRLLCGRRLPEPLHWADRLSRQGR
jgi:deoxyribonuclease V